MNFLETMKMRLNYQGGNAERRMQIDKLRGLRKALLYSYQAATAILADGREFRCLINPDLTKPDYDNKIISIPYKDICLNKQRDERQTTLQGMEEIGMKPGDVFTWKETDTHWLVDLEFLEEDAYFRAEIRRCDEEIEINGNKYWVYLRGPLETDIDWQLKHNINWNNLNYSLIMYITKNKETEEYFQRFNLIKINGNNWEVQTKNTIYGDGIIKVCLKEYFNNSIEENQVPKSPEPNPEPTEGTYIMGPKEIYPFDVVTYTIENSTEKGLWQLEGKAARIKSSNEKSITMEVIRGKSGSFKIQYIQGEQKIELPITIVPF